MKEFINYAFYGCIPEGIKPETIYKLYVVYCMLFKYEPLNKFEFLEAWNDWIK